MTAMQVISRLFFLLCVTAVLAAAKEVLVFGAISTVKPALMEANLSPLLRHLELVTGKRVVFATGRDYEDTINKFVNGTFDFGYIGPAPFLLAQAKAPDALQIVAGLESNGKPYFHSVIVTRKDSGINRIEELAGRRFAFGSPNSTLSYFVPMEMLMQAGIDKKLQRFDFLGRHDRVAQYVIMGKYDAGAIKASVAKKYDRYLKVIATSAPIRDFVIVTHRRMNPEMVSRLRASLLGCSNKTVLESIKSGVTGFVDYRVDDYDDLRRIMRRVNER